MSFVLIAFFIQGVVLKALKRRLSNIKPVNRPQGPCPKKRKYLHVHNDHSAATNAGVCQIPKVKDHDAEESKYFT